MRTLGFFLLLLTVSTAHADCPIEAEGETSLDCPWAEIARQAATIIKSDPTPETSAPKIEGLLQATAPDFLKRLKHEGALSRNVKKLWGLSINYDENAKGTIIPEALIDVILAAAHAPARNDRIVNAGFEHTYGYLLSILKTPYGYKRLRWVRPDIENGFGLEQGTISPAPKSGGLYMNVTYFAGQIAFRGKDAGDLAAKKLLRKARGVASSLRRYPYSSLHGRRLTETVTIAEGRTVELRTDFVPFPKASGDATGGNTELLVYSIRDSAEPLPYLISAFPIAKGFSDGALNPANLGEGKPVMTRYNAFVPGMTDTKILLTGKREASSY